MPYQVIKKINGQEYLYEMESFREGKKIKNRIIKYYGSLKKPSNQLISKQSLNLEKKIEYSLRKIDEFYQEMNGKVYVSFSGGKDSTVLLHLVRELYPNVPAVFVDTGLEYPEIRDFVRTIPNVIRLNPKIPFTRVLSDYGFPVVSKLVSTQVRILRNPTEANKKTRSIYETGYINQSGKNGQFKLADKWKFLLDAPFKISEKCCLILKKKPISKFEQESGLKPYIGTMASDSYQRTVKYAKTKCNSFGKNAMSRPLSVWNESDIWNYIEKYDIKYSNIYDLGYDRTGCMFCLFGLHKEKINRFELMKWTHPTQYKYCMETLGIQEKLEFIKNGTLNKNQGQICS